MRKSTFFAFFTPVISFFDDVSQKILSLLNCLPIDRQQKRKYKGTCSSGKALLAVKNKKVKKLHFFGHKLRFLVNIPHLELKTPLLTFSYNCYTEAYAKIQRDPTGGFRNRFPGGHFFE